MPVKRWLGRMDEAEISAAEARNEIDRQFDRAAASFIMSHHYNYWASGMRDWMQDIGVGQARA